MGFSTLLEPENDVEQQIMLDKEWLLGIEWGKPRPGHAEGKVRYHVIDVLRNVNTMPDRTRLRLITLVHDTFKYRVDPNKPKVGTNHHGWFAHQFTTKYSHDSALLDVVLLHDEAYNAYSVGERRGDWTRAEKRARELIERLQSVDALKLYIDFFFADNNTDSKEDRPFFWFVDKCNEVQPGP